MHAVPAARGPGSRPAKEAPRSGIAPARCRPAGCDRSCPWGSGCNLPARTATCRSRFRSGHALCARNRLHPHRHCARSTPWKQRGGKERRGRRGSTAPPKEAHPPSGYQEWGGLRRRTHGAGAVPRYAPMPLEGVSGTDATRVRQSPGGRALLRTGPRGSRHGPGSERRLFSRDTSQASPHFIIHDARLIGVDSFDSSAGRCP